MKPLLLAVVLSVLAAATTRDKEFVLPRPQFVATTAQMIVREAWKAGISPHLAFWLAESESGLQEGAVAKELPGRGMSHGIMQLNDLSFPQATRMTPKENIAAGVAYFGKLYGMCRKRPACAVRAYRTGKVDLW